MSSKTPTIDGEVVGRVEKSNGDVIIVRLTEYRDVEYLDVRTFFKDKATGELLPGKGIAIPRALSPEVVELIIKADDRLHTPRMPSQ